ncbi:alpha-amylase family glycosyl hydrolase [Candidatus Pelagibacter sp.]|nr:alpha-amylase family glycosyl hydrolase [Candidatus Pelagibacter sp.]
MLSQQSKKEIKRKLNFIYKSTKSINELKIYADEIFEVINKYNKFGKKGKKLNVSEKTSALICYGDSLLNNKEKTIKIFRKFYKKNLDNFFEIIHFLPFYPSSSDSGFAVKDHYQVDKRLGDWSEINKQSKNTNIMADVVINHASSKGLWFKNFLANKSPGKDYFLTVNKKFDTSKVVRPRENKLLKKISIFKKNNLLWRTFSDDQIDLNFKNPKVLLRFIKIIINLANNGVTIFRLDAIAYLWKKSGSNCVNLKETHEIIRLLRVVCNSLKSKPIIITETNLPEKENLSYFGVKNEESHWIYNFSLPPLLIHSFLFEDSTHLNKWSKNLPMTKIGNNYLNFIASHDGIGMRPAEGYLNKHNLSKFFKRLKKNGGQLSYRKVKGTSKKVYEANITLFNAFQKTDYDKKGKYFLERYISAHAIMIAFEGIPAIYFNSLFGTSNDDYKYIISGNKRDLNRYKWNKDRLENLLKKKYSKQSIFYHKILNLIFIKKQNKAFHPNAQRENLNMGKKIFCFKRTSLDKKQVIYNVTNLSSKFQRVILNHKFEKYKNLFDKSKKSHKLILKPHETLWLSN